MYILGVSCYYHDAAAVLLRDGVLVAAAEEERFSRKKHDYRFPARAMEFCLAQAGIQGSDLEYVVFYEKPLLKFERILMTALGSVPGSLRVFRESMIAWFKEKLWIKGLLMTRLKVPAKKILFVEHHLSHAASAFFSSPFRDAAVLTLDGVGEWTTAAWGRAEAQWGGEGRNQITLSHEIKFPHSLGLLYSAFTAFLGFEVNEGEYKVMGMAPYGTPRHEDDVYKVVQVEADGSFRLNLEFFEFYRSTERTYNRRFLDLFGPPRAPESPFFTPRTHPERDGEAARRNQGYADIAASIQRVTEEIILKMARHVHAQTGSEHLCMAGGVALNSVANGRLMRETGFKDIFIQPAAGDSGGALGAALYVHHVVLNQPRKFVMEHAYWGQGFSRDEIRRFLDGQSVAYRYVPDDDDLCREVAEAIADGKVVGWFQGRFEWGPRALGARSIMADPRRSEMKEIVNTKIKFREPFRPFAPVVLEERAQEFFAVDDPKRHYPYRFMLAVSPIHEPCQALIPAVNHGGTGRLQTIRRDINALYHDVVEKFGEFTGIPVVMNTSFNLRGEPIVSTPAHAWNSFTKSGLDLLVMDHFVVHKP